jgi:chromosomal replication initiation ATPase DnaA
MKTHVNHIGIVNLDNTPTPISAINVVADFYGFSVNYLKSDLRKKELMKAKKTAIYLLVELFNKSPKDFKKQIPLQVLGNHLNYTHSDMLHHYKTCKNLMDTEIKLAMEIDEIRIKILEGQGHEIKPETIADLKNNPELINKFI